MIRSITPLFSVPVYDSELQIKDSEHDAFLDVVKSLEYQQCFDSNDLKNGLITIEQNILELKELQHLKELIENELNIYLYECLKINSSNTLRHVCSWAVKHQFGDKSYEHCHSNSVFSGVYYLKVPKNSGEYISFHKSDYYMGVCPYIEEYNILNSTTWKMNVYDKKILLFPSHLKHSVPISKSQESRYCISFNYYLSGKFGYNTTYATL